MTIPEIVIHKEWKERAAEQWAREAKALEQQVIELEESILSRLESESTSSQS
ncbi:hypothetical protein [Helicobacter cinaedi]|uniref:hypothetical protein n=1 Tax=Helicobacter cinaedi TaxID=213 RepID=UPI0014034FEA|nr:hypothetical protein [Helicobacter cinaedi]